MMSPGRATSRCGGDSGGILTSLDGVNWTRRDTGFVSPLLSVVWTGKQLVAAGTNVIVTSPDGITWTERVRVATQISSLAWTGNRLMAV